MTEAPIFIVGTPRSGTTLTGTILDRHSGIHVPSETAFMKAIYTKRRDIGDPATDPAARARIVEILKGLHRVDIQHRDFVAGLFAERDLENRLLAMRSYADAFATFMGAQMEARGRHRWGNHYPADLFELQHLLAMFPDAKVIICVRSVFDFMTSYRNKWRHSEREGREENAKRLRKLYHPVITSLLWKGSMRVAGSALDRWSDRLFLSRYEDLVKDPEQHVRRLCDFVGEPFEAGMLEVGTNNSSEEVAERGIFTASIGRWRSQLTPSEAFVAQVLCRKEMQRFGYPHESLQPNAAEVARYFAGAPFHGWTALTSGHARGTPMLPYLSKRVRSLMPGVPRYF